MAEPTWSQTTLTISTSQKQGECSGATADEPHWVWKQKHEATELAREGLAGQQVGWVWLARRTLRVSSSWPWETGAGDISTVSACHIRGAACCQVIFVSGSQPAPDRQSCWVCKARKCQNIKNTENKEI